MKAHQNDYLHLQIINYFYHSYSDPLITHSMKNLNHLLNFIPHFLYFNLSSYVLKFTTATILNSTTLKKLVVPSCMASNMGKEGTSSVASCLGTRDTNYAYNHFYSLPSPAF